MMKVQPNKQESEWPDNQKPAKKRKSFRFTDVPRMKEIGGRLKRLRTTLNITLVDMSRLTGISLGYICVFERGKNLPNSKYLLYLIDNFKVNLNFIITGNGNMFLEGDDLRNQEKVYDFGVYQDEIDEMLSLASRMPGVMHAVLEFFSTYKFEKERIIKAYLERLEETEKETPAG